MFVIAVGTWIVVLSAYLAAILIFLHRKLIVSACVLVFLSILLLVRPIFIFSGLDVPAPDNFFSNVWQLSISAHLASLIWLLIFVALVSASRAVAPKLPLPDAPAAPSPSMIAVACIAMTLVGLASTSFLVISYGSVSRFVLAVKVEKDLSGAYIIRHISVLASLLCIYALFASVTLGEKSRPIGNRCVARRDIYLYVSLIFVNLTMNYFWGNRMNIALVLLSLALGYHIFVRRFTLFQVFLFLSIAVAGLFGLRFLRDIFLADELNLEMTSLEKMSFIRGLSFSLHFAQFDALMLAIQDLGVRFQPNNGQDFINGLLSWIPRFLYPDKENFHVGAWFRQIYEPDRINGWPVTVIGSWLVNFGYLGVPLGAAVSGVLCGLFDRTLNMPDRHPWHAMLAPAIGFVFFEGGYNTGTPQQLFLTLIPMCIIAATLTLWMRMVESTRLRRTRRAQLDTFCKTPTRKDRIFGPVA